MAWFPLEPLGEVTRWWQSLLLCISLKLVSRRLLVLCLDARGKWDRILWVDVAGVIQLYCV